MFSCVIIIMVDVRVVVLTIVVDGLNDVDEEEQDGERSACFRHSTEPREFHYPCSHDGAGLQVPH